MANPNFLITNFIPNIKNIVSVLSTEYQHTNNAGYGHVEFYKKAGFHLNDYPYVQPPYRKGGNGVELILMSWPHPLADPERIKKELYTTVYHVDN